MPESLVINQIRLLVSENRLDQAIHLLNLHKISDDGIKLSRRFIDLEEQNRSGVISTEIYNIEKNKISASILKSINTIDIDFTKKEVKDLTSFHKIYLISSLIGALFLVLWIVLQWGANWAIQNLSLSELSRIVLYIFQALLAITTLAPIVFNLYRDIRIMFIRVKRNIKAEQEMLAKLDLGGEFSSEMDLMEGKIYHYERKEKDRG